MKTFRFLFLLCFLSLAGAAGLRAQQFDNPVKVPINYYGQAYTSYGVVGQYSSFSFGSSLGDTASASVLNSGGGQPLYSNLATAYVVPGVTYNVTVTSSNVLYTVVLFQPVNGCEYYINGWKGNSYSAGTNYTFTLRVEKINDITQGLAGKRGGACSAFPEDKPIWYIGLGSLRNGQFAGAVGFRQATISSSLWNTSSLVYDTVDASEVSVTRDGNGYITEIDSRDVTLLMDPYNPSGTSYNIKVCPAGSTTPFITYTISQYSVSGGTGIRIDKAEDSSTWSTVLEQVGSTWTRYDWQQVSGAGGSLNTSRPVTTAVSGSTSTVQYGTSGDDYIKEKTYTTVGSQTELASQVFGPGNPSAPTTTYAYYTNSSGTGWFDAVQSIVEPTGNWTKYDYYNTANDSRQGLVENIYRPWLSSPSSPSGATSINCDFTSYSYTTNYDGSTTAPSSRTESIDGTPVGKTTWAYNWAYATVNSHDLAQIVEDDYTSSSSYLTTTTLAYREDDADTFFHGKLHSVTRPDGTKDSYAYYYGTWNSSTNSFNATGTGNDRYILIFHGQTSAGTGTTYVSSWTAPGGESWNLDPLYLVNDLSTVTETVVDTHGRVVFSGQNVYTGSDIERISGHAYAFNTNNLPATDTDLERSVPGTGGTVAVTYAYQAGLMTSKVGIDGVETAWTYENFLNPETVTTAYGDSGSYPARTETYAYTSSNLKKSDRVGSNTATTYTYDTSGRLIQESDPKPGGGSLTTSYSFPSDLETDTALPTGGTRTTVLYLDGKLDEQGGSAQVPQQVTYALATDGSGDLVKTVWTGSSSSNGGWVETTTDWLGRTVLQRTPEVNWSSGSPHLAVRKAYAYSAATGQLSSVTTTDESTGAQLLPEHLYLYGNLGLLTEEGDDVNGNGSLDNVSSDRIRFYSTDYYKDTGAYNGWLKETVTQVLRNINDGSSLTTVSDVRRRFTQFNDGAMHGSARVISDVVSFDPSGRATSTWIWANATNQTRTKSVMLQGVSQAAVTTWQNGYLASEESFSGVTQTYAYNGQGMTTSVTEGTTNAQMSYTYYSGTNYQETVTRTTGPSTSATSTYSYGWNPASGVGATVSVTDAGGYIAYTDYNDLGLPIHAWGSAVQPSLTTYDAYGRKTGVTTWQSGSFSGSTWPNPAGGNAVAWTLDPATGLVLDKTYPNGKEVQFNYNARGQTTKRVWARGAETDYSYYDSAGSLTGELDSVTYHDSTPSVTYTYTRTGALATVADAAGTRTFAYRSDLQVDTESFDSSFYTSGSVALTSDYDSYGRPTGYSANGNVTVNESVDYDGTTGRISSITGGLNSDTTTFDLGYASGTDLVDSVTDGSYSRSTPIVSRYDVIASATTTWSGSQLGEFTDQYTDARGLRTGQTSGASGSPSTSWSHLLGLGDGLKSAYSSDGFGQLSTAPTPSWTGAAGTQSLAARNFGWTYDLAANRASETGAYPTSYTANSVNEYSSITGSLGETLSYDADGNLTQDGTWTYTYDSENRLIAMSASGQSLSFEYDYLGRRLSKTVNGTTTKFLWQGWTLAADLRSDGYNVIRGYVWGLDQAGGAGNAGALLAVYNPGFDLAFAIPDALGNIVGYYDVSAAAIVSAVEYSPYGRAINSAGDLADYPIGFSGEYEDWESALVYYGRRYYEPKHGRFINRDPIEEAGGLNLYGFCGNNAVNGWDSLGEDGPLSAAQIAELQTKAEEQGAILEAMLSNFNHGWGSGGQNPDFQAAIADDNDNAWVGAYDFSPSGTVGLAGYTEIGDGLDFGPNSNGNGDELGEIQGGYFVPLPGSDSGQSSSANAAAYNAVGGPVTPLPPIYVNENPSGSDLATVIYQAGLEQLSSYLSSSATGSMPQPSAPVPGSNSPAASAPDSSTANNVAPNNAEASGGGFWNMLGNMVSSITHNPIYAALVPGQAAWNSFIDSGGSNVGSGAVALGQIAGTVGTFGLGGLFDEAVSAAENAGGNLVNVIHFSDQAGADAIQASGSLRAGSYVTLPSEVAGMTQAEVEEFLEIQPGRGATSTTIQVPQSQLVTPPNGPFTSGGATQFQITVPTPPGTFVPTPQ